MISRDAVLRVGRPTDNLEEINIVVFYQRK
ncbi:MAG: hypothetical protein RLZZ337_1391 [Bacteroidota bacterium]|jgi:hypothetical protein